MCGFVGILSKNTTLFSDAVEAAFGTIGHRGPNDSGRFESSWIRAGFRRLSILDLSPKGHQPMSFGKYHILFNGEVYNYRDIRDELEGLGYIFESNTDTEVVLKAFVQWGEACLHRFNGMWAFAIIDDERRKIFFCRDRLGIKPLYYAHKPGIFFAFASEIKALRPFLRFEENRARIFEYIVYRSIVGSETPIKEIYALMPGEYLVYEWGPDSIRRERYYRSQALSHYMDAETAAAKVEELLIDAVRLRLISDVEVGLQLSGGVDSSLIAAIVQTHFPRQSLHSYSISFPGSELDESPYQRMVAKRYGITHHEIPFGSADFARHLDRAVWHEEYPLVHPSSVAILRLTEVAHEKIVVMLGGEGADEIFCGYPKYKYAANRRLLSCLMRLNPVSGALIPPISKLRTLRNLVRGRSAFDVMFVETRRNEDIHPFLTAYEDTGFDERLAFMRNSNPEQAVALLDQATSLRVLLRRFDRMTMAASIEGRVPFCDYRLLEYANSLPMRSKIRPGMLKIILKKLAEKYLPVELIYREKMGFSLPIHRWFQKEEALSDLIDLLRDRKFLDRCVVDAVMLRNFLDRKTFDEREFNEVIWPLLSYELWFRKFIA